MHASLLPRYRGAAPIAWAIYRGETQSGVTIIRMSTGLDAGDILAQEATPIGPDETAGELETRLAQIGGRLALQIVDRLAAGPVQEFLINHWRPRLLTKELGLIDWCKPPGDLPPSRHASWPTP